MGANAPNLKHWLALFLLGTALEASVLADAVAVRHPEGIVHGFLILKGADGSILADGDLIQNAHGDTVTSRLVFHFRDGSLHDETVVYRQRGTFQMISDHQVQKGPSFPHPIDITVDAASGRVSVKSWDKDGKEKTTDEQMKLPADIANGLILTLIKNLPASGAATASMVAATPKPLLVKLDFAREGEDSLSVGGTKRTATRYVVKIEIGGVKGVLADLLGKKPPDTHVWILGGEAPAFLKSTGPLSMGGPPWTIELTSPNWPKAAATK
ncbi:MAG TPA: hypothetical protein VKJ00_02050 [Thermoanaerobaculia bacterium]|nr:hypothetical protein [Thermoanaerobaculia bacterium]